MTYIFCVRRVPNDLPSIIWSKSLDSQTMQQRGWPVLSQKLREGCLQLSHFLLPQLGASLGVDTAIIHICKMSHSRMLGNARKSISVVRKFPTINNKSVLDLL